jgi:hypothetical protein
MVKGTKMFLKSDHKMLTLPTLKRLCKNKGIPNYSKMKKETMINECNKLFATLIIQKCFRNHFYKNAVDSITLDSVRFPCFIYRVKCGKIFFYGYDSIIKYIMKTGKVIDPNTRNEYTDTELQRLDTEAKIHFPNKNFKSTLKIKKNENYARRIRNRENDILSVQMRLDEIKAIVLTIIEDNILSWNLNEPMIIENVEYRNFDAYINSLIYELKVGYSCLKTYSEFESKCFKDSFLSDIHSKSEYFQNIISNF